MRVETNGSRRVLILTADVGEGHLAAGRALRDGLLGCHDVTVTLEDGLRCLAPSSRRIIRDGYHCQLRAAPWSYNVLYRVWCRATPVRTLGGWLLYRGARRRLAALIARERPAVVVSTHPALTAALGRMRRRGELPAALCATIVDLAGDPLWCDRGVDRHLVHPIAIPWVERHAGRGRAVAVRPLVAPRFLVPRSRASARALLGLPATGTIVLVSGGGWGVGALDEAADAACAAGADTVIVLAGREERVADSLRERLGADPRIRVLGFVEHIDVLMRAADAIIHSTGGMTSLEAIASGCPLIAFGTRLAHVQEHDRTLARLGLCRIADDRTSLQAALVAQFTEGSPAADPGAHTAVPSLDAAGAVVALLPARRSQPDAGPVGAAPEPSMA